MRTEAGADEPAAVIKVVRLTTVIRVTHFVREMKVRGLLCNLGH